MIAVWYLHNNKMVIQAKWVQTVDVWLFYEIVGKVNIFRAEDQGEKIHLILQINMMKEI